MSVSSNHPVDTRSFFSANMTTRSGTVSNRRARAPTFQAVATAIPSILLGLTDEDQRAVLAATTRHRYSPGEVIFREGDRGDTLHIISKGHVAIRTTTPLGDVATFAVLGPGEVFGEHALLDAAATRSASAAALDVVEARSMRRDDFVALREAHRNVDHFLLAAFAATVRRLNDHLVEALYIPADKRVLRRLASLAGQYEDPDGTVTIPLTQDDIASLAGTARPTVNRILRAAQADGLVTIARGRLEINDLPGLRHRAR